MSIRGTWISFRQRLGLRGEILFALGLVDFAQAWTMWTDQTSSINDWFESVLPPYVWVALWTTVGVSCLVHAFRQDDHLGFVAAIGIKVIWVIGAFAAWALSNVTPVGVALWALVAFIVWRISRLTEPTFLERSDGRDDQV